MCTEAHSLINYSYLKEFYRSNDPDEIENSVLRTKLVRGEIINSIMKKWFFEKFKKNHGKLFCQVCKKTNLIESGKDIKKKDIPFLATIEHIIPTSQGGLKYHYSNFLVTCDTCNSNRGILPMFQVSEFLWIY